MHHRPVRPRLHHCHLVGRAPREGARREQGAWRSVWRQVPFWLLVLAAMFIIRALVGEGRITFAAAGFVSMLLMGLALALDGLVASGWRFTLLGLALMGMTLLTAWFAAYMWLLLPLALLTWWVAPCWTGTCHTPPAPHR